MKNEHSVDKLNGLLRDELAAIETYDEALRGRSAFSGKTELSLCRRSHETRADALRRKIMTLGGLPVDSSGLRGVWSKVVERGAVAAGNEMAIRVLEQGEEHVLRDYLEEMPELEPTVRAFVQDTLLPEERYTHDVLYNLKERLVH